MSLINDIKSDVRRARGLQISPRMCLCWIAVCVAVELALRWVGRANLGLPMLNSIAVISFTLILKRKELGDQVWFWTTMAILAAIQVLLIFSIPWTSKWVPAAAIAGFDVAEFVLMLSIISFVKMLAMRSK